MFIQLAANDHGLLLAGKLENFSGRAALMLH
jgi:hypothetical protein